MKNYINFEEWLMYKHQDDYIWTDDNAPDDYNEWISEQDSETMIWYAEQRHKSEQIKQTINSIISNLND